MGLDLINREVPLLNEVLVESGISPEEFSIQSGEGQKYFVKEKQGAIKTLEGLDQVLAYANQWLRDHPGAAKKRGANYHPLFSRVGAFVLIDEDAKPGADTFIYGGFSKRSIAEFRTEPEKSASAPTSNKNIKKIFRRLDTVKLETHIRLETIDQLLPSGNIHELEKLVTSLKDQVKKIEAEQGRPVPRLAELKMRNVVSEEEEPFYREVLALAKGAFPPEELKQLKEALCFEGNEEAVYVFDEAGYRLQKLKLFNSNLPLVLATLEKLQKLDWKGLGFPEEKLHPAAFMKQSFGIGVKRDPALPNFLTPLHALHLAGHPDKKLHWNDPYVIAQFNRFVTKAGVVVSGENYFFKDRLWMTLRDEGILLSVQFYKSTGELDREVKVLADQPQRTFQLKVPQDVRKEPFELSVHGRTVKIFAPKASKKTQATIENWGRFLALIPEPFIPPVADRFLKKDVVSIQLAEDHQSFTINWGNAIANAIAGAYPVYLPEGEDISLIHGFVIRQAKQEFPDSPSRQEAIRKFYWEGATTDSVMEFPGIFWDLFSDFINQGHRAPLDRGEPVLLQWLYLARYFSDYHVDSIGNVAKVDLFKQETLDKIKSGYVEPGWEELSSPLSGTANRKSGPSPYRLPVRLGAQLNFGKDGNSWSPALGAQFYQLNGAVGYGANLGYALAPADGENRHQFIFGGLLRLQKEFIPEDRQLKGGVLAYAGIRPGVRVLTPSGKMGPEVGMEVGLQVFQGWGLGLGAATNGKKDGSSLGLMLTYTPSF